MSFIDWIDMLRDVSWYAPLYLLGAFVVAIWVIAIIGFASYWIGYVFKMAIVMVKILFGDLEDYNEKEIWRMYKNYQNVSNGKKTFKQYKNWLYSLDFTEIEKLNKEETK